MSLSWEEKMNNLAHWVKESQRIVVFTGAGVSTESGVPDFRSPGGIWDRFDPQEMTFQKFLSNKESRRKYWDLFHVCWKEFDGVQPNRAHQVMATLEEYGKVTAVVTQNVDGLHQMAGNSPDKVFELHGTMWKVRCLSCDNNFSWKEIFKQLEEGKEIEECERCGGLLKPATIAFGQSLPEEAFDQAYKHILKCDLFLCIGSSLVVYPAARLPQIAKSKGARMVIINREPTPLDSIADLVIIGKAGEVMNEILRMVKESW